MWINKKKIIQALKKEKNLEPGMWVENDDLPDVGNCQVCAVGAVLRHGLGMDNLTIEVFVGEASVLPASSVYKDFETLLSERRFFSALSHIFEVTDGSSEDRREAAIKLVKERFPDKIEISEALLKRTNAGATGRLICAGDYSGLLQELFGAERRDVLLENASELTATERTRLKKAVTKIVKAEIKVQERFK